MKRLLVHVEGQTEEEFTNEVLRPHLTGGGFVSVSARLLGPRRQRSHRGGIRSWASARGEIERHLREDQTTLAGLLVDYYGMPTDWPGRDEAACLPVEARAGHLASRLRDELPEELRSRFVPCILMHEFEAMVFADPVAAAAAWGRPDVAAQLEAVKRAFPTVEHINDSPLTAPSRRLLALDPGYEKPLQGVLAVLEIGLPRLRAECPSLDGWLTTLERR